MKKLLGCFLCVILLGFGAQAHALLITPESGTIDVCRYEGDQTSQAEIDVWIAANIGDIDELYKQNVGGSEVGALADSYRTEFFNTPTDPSEAIITYTGDGPIATDAFLLVKDGNQSPAWYLFDLNCFDWNGMVPLELEDFWPDQGAISHVSLYGGQSVPEPATMFLLGTGLLGLALFRKSRFKK